MAAQTVSLIAPRLAPQGHRGVRSWLRRNLWSNRVNALTTWVLIAIAVYTLPQTMHWLWTEAVFRADAPACQAARGTGACWGVIAEKYRFILLGRYPEAQHWRPVLATSALLIMLVVACMRWAWRPWLPVLAGAVVVLFFVLMHGGVAGLVVVPSDRWGGLPLTVMLSALSMALAFPLSVAVALGRRSDLPIIRALCTVYVELIRGVPLISVLFMASFMLPLLLPPGLSIDVLLRVLLGITLFAAAYMAEIVRGGLQAIPAGQVEAAASLGLSYWQTQRKIVLPQALAHVVPAIVNNFIAIFKDTSLVTIVSLYELTGALSLALNSDADWRPFKLEAYLFIAGIYFVFCFALSRYGLWVERQLARAVAR